MEKYKFKKREKKTIDENLTPMNESIAFNCRKGKALMHAT